MSTQEPTPLDDALGAFHAFAAHLPPSTGDDLRRLTADLVSSIREDLNEAIADHAPNIPIIRPLIVREMQAIADETLEGAAMAIETEYPK